MPVRMRVTDKRNGRGEKSSGIVSIGRVPQGSDGVDEKGRCSSILSTRHYRADGPRRTAYRDRRS